jgi:uncharacterized membrane protein
MEEWEIQYRKNQEDKRDGMSQLTDGQLEAIKEATEVIKDAVSTMHQSYEISVTQLGKLDSAYWGLHHQFENTGEDD